MIPGQTAVTSAYLEHFTEMDVALLQPGDPRAMSGGDRATLARADPQELNELLASQRVFESVFAAPGAGDPLLTASPFLVFAVDRPPCRGAIGIGGLRLRMAGAGPAHARVRRGRVARVHGRAVASPLPGRAARVLHACGERVGGRPDAPRPAPAAVLRTRSGPVLGPSRGGLRCGASRCPAPVGGPGAVLDRCVPRLCGAQRVRPDRRGPPLAGRWSRQWPGGGPAPRARGGGLR